MISLSRLTQLGDALIDLLFPPQCVGCGRERSWLCVVCLDSSPRHDNPLSPSAPSALDGLFSPFYFEGVMRQAIHRLKYDNLKAIAGLLAQLLAEHLKRHPLPSQAVVPVPLHPRRLRQRGYNQSALIARELGRIIHQPVIEEGLKRLRDTPPQARAKTAEERRRNVEGAFVCPHRGLEGKSLLLIDDVSTTGATLQACALALRQGGAAQVWGLTVARER